MSLSFWIIVSLLLIQLQQLINFQAAVHAASVERFVARFFKNASDRHGGREKRRKLKEGRENIAQPRVHARFFLQLHTQYVSYSYFCT